MSSSATATQADKFFRRLEFKNVLPRDDISLTFSKIEQWLFDIPYFKNTETLFRSPWINSSGGEFTSWYLGVTSRMQKSNKNAELQAHMKLEGLIVILFFVYSVKTDK